MKHADTLAFIDSQHEHMKQLVFDWSAINSGSLHLEGLARMRAVLKDNFFWLGGEMEEIPLAPMTTVNSQGEVTEQQLGHALRIRKRPHSPLHVFLCGHYDTVFGKDHPFQTPVLVDDNTINGPGVADLKGGLVVMLKALEALERSPYAENLGWEVLLNPDEEIGSVGSDSLLQEAATRNHIGLIYEPSLPDGTLVSDRKGSGNFTLVVRGKAAHAGREHHVGRNAVVALADATLRLNALNGLQEGLTVNPAKLEGGGALNVVPDLAILRWNVRVTTHAQQAWCEVALQEMVNALASAYDADYRFTLHGGFTRPPKTITARDEALWHALTSSANMLGLTLNRAPSGGCCDGNNLAAYGLSNIDTLGVRGGHIHSDKEYILLDSLSERAKLSALVLLRLAAGDVVLDTANVKLAPPSRNRP
jgi:glutamate carboxypeptidase